MSTSSRAKKYLDEFWSLSVEERAQVLDDISHGSAPTEDPALLEEIDRRLERYERGDVVLHEPEEVARYIRNKYARK